MCTVSWLHHANGYVLLCNRDERHTRKPALGPRISQRNGVSFIAPEDGDHGGSWVGVNHFGLTLCLLNRYGEYPESPGSFTSRGLLLTDLLDCKAGQHVQQQLNAVNLEQFRPLTMAVLASDEPAMLIDWTGRELLVQPNAEGYMPLTSSSLQELNAVGRRREYFQQLVSEAGKLDAELLDRFHRSHVPLRGPYSVCMHREDAATVSLSALTVTREIIEFIYHGSSPCSEVPIEKVLLERTYTGSQAAQTVVS
jgi:uncharacterized protein with NRDE domain